MLYLHCGSTKKDRKMPLLSRTEAAAIIFCLSRITAATDRTLRCHSLVCGADSCMSSRRFLFFQLNLHAFSVPLLLSLPLAPSHAIGGAVCRSKADRLIDFINLVL